MTTDEISKYRVHYDDELEELVSKERENRGLNRVLERIDHFFKLARIIRFIHHFLQIIVIVGATLLPFLLNIPDLPKAILIILSSLVAVAVALINFYKFGERSQNLFLTSEALRKEYNLYIHFQGPYDKYLPRGEKAYELFKERTEAIILAENLRSFTVDELPELQRAIIHQARRKQKISQSG